MALSMLALRKAPGIDRPAIAVLWLGTLELERLFVTAPTALADGEHVLHIEFRGTLNDKLRGWYRSVYRDTDGNDHTIAATQMQSTDARRAFPCWDEPDFKAVFAVTLVVFCRAASLTRMSRDIADGSGL